MSVCSKDLRVWLTQGASLCDCGCCRMRMCFSERIRERKIENTLVGHVCLVRSSVGINDMTSHDNVMTRMHDTVGTHMSRQ